MSTMTVSAGCRAGIRPTTRASRRPAAKPPVRLTRRARLLVTGLLTSLLVATAVLATGGPVALGGTGSPGGPGSVRPAVTRQVTVAPGETLWQIAQRVAPGADPRETVARILELNGLQTAQVQAGTALRLP